MTPTKLLAPAVEGSRFTWRFADTVFEVDASCGARITRFSLGGDDILTGPDVNALNFGATFWPSPQSQWGWPPPVAIDSGPYQAAAVDPEGAAMRFTGGADPGLGIAATKTFSIDAARGVVTIGYALVNQSAQTRAIAPWEISRHPTNGLTFFPARGADDGHAPVVELRSNLAVVETAGAIWLEYDARAITDHQKLFARCHPTEGWIAHVDIARRLHLVKTFPPIDAVDEAPGEAAIELYADPNHTYVEVEQQGAVAALAPGESSTWTVTWRLRRLPSSIALRAGDRELLAASRALAGG